ncbi:MAG: ATP-binding cassette domain-containing protein, partial [Deltaproteobacteria bacterium]|nr:ATP-binding cassette domain-containing protein [Deltaproteobacteria bacterium]
MTVPLLRVYGITMNFSGLRALNEVSFDMEEGAVTGIIGPNGAGKSTLFNVIAGDLTPTSGKVFFADEDITGFSPDMICRAGISRTYQSVRPFLGLSVMNNLKVSMLYGRGGDKVPKSRVEPEILAILETVQ